MKPLSLHSGWSTPNRLDDAQGAAWMLAGRPLPPGVRLELRLPDSGRIVPVRWELLEGGQPALHVGDEDLVIASGLPGSFHLRWPP